MVPVLRFKALWPWLEEKTLSSPTEAVFFLSLPGQGIGGGQMLFSSRCVGAGECGRIERPLKSCWLPLCETRAFVHHQNISSPLMSAPSCDLPQPMRREQKPSYSFPEGTAARLC